MLRKAIVIVGIGLSLSACGDSPVEGSPTDTPARIVEKKIDPPHYKTEKVCVKKFKNGECAKWQKKRKETDDKDWIFVTDNNREYDVEESEYNNKNVGDLWPE